MIKYSEEIELIDDVISKTKSLIKHFCDIGNLRGALSYNKRRLLLQNIRNLMTEPKKEKIEDDQKAS